MLPTTSELEAGTVDCGGTRNHAGVSGLPRVWTHRGSGETRTRRHGGGCARNWGNQAAAPGHQWPQRVQACRQRGDPDDVHGAVRHLEKSLKMDEDGSLHYQLARNYQPAGLRDKAAATTAQYREILKRNQQPKEDTEREGQISPRSNLVFSVSCLTSGISRFCNLFVFLFHPCNFPKINAVSPHNKIACFSI